MIVMFSLIWLRNNGRYITVGTIPSPILSLRVCGILALPNGGQPILADHLLFGSCFISNSVEFIGLPTPQ